LTTGENGTIFWLEAELDRFSAFLSLGMLMACGAGSSQPTAPATSGPAPDPVDCNGTYTSTAMSWRDPVGSMTVTASITVTQIGQRIYFSRMIVSSPIRGRHDYPMGPAILSGNAFNHTNEFATAGCGQISNHYRGHFSAGGDAMNITMTFIASGGFPCVQVEISGEMRRARP
jgi:hypothetical protein